MGLSGSVLLAVGECLDTSSCTKFSGAWCASGPHHQMAWDDQRFFKHAGTHYRKAQLKNAEHWKKLSPSTSKDMMGSVDVNVIVVDIDHPLPMVLCTFSKKRWRAILGWRVGANVCPLVIFTLDTAK